MHEMQRECVCGGVVRALAPPPPHAGGVRRGATAPPRGALGAEPQAKNANLPIKPAFSHQKGAFGRAGKVTKKCMWERRDLGQRWRSEDWKSIWERHTFFPLPPPFPFPQIILCAGRKRGDIRLGHGGERGDTRQGHDGERGDIPCNQVKEHRRRGFSKGWRNYRNCDRRLSLCRFFMAYIAVTRPQTGLGCTPGPHY